MFRSAAQYHILTRDTTIMSELRRTVLGRDVSTLISEYATIDAKCIDDLNTDQSSRNYEYKRDQLTINFIHTFNMHKWYMPACHWLAKPCNHLTPHVHVWIDMGDDTNGTDVICYHIDIIECLESGDPTELVDNIMDELSVIDYDIDGSIIHESVLGYMDSLIW